MKTLLVNQSELVYVVLEKVLHDMNCEVLGAKSDIEGYNLCLENHFDLIIVDMDLCVENNCQLLSIIQNSLIMGTLSVLFIVDEETDEIKSKMKDMGVDSYIKRPICINTFKTKIQEFKIKYEIKESLEQAITFELREEKYKNLKKMLTNYMDMNKDKFEYIKSKWTLKYYTKGDIIYYPEGICDSFIYINYGVAKGVQNSTGKLWYLYFNHDSLDNNDYSHAVIQDYFSYIYSSDSNIYFEALTDCEVLYIKYKDLEDIFIKYDSFDTFKYMLSDLEMKRIDKQIEEHDKRDGIGRFAKFMKDKKFLFSEVDYQPISEYLQMDMDGTYNLKKEISNQRVTSCYEKSIDCR